MSQQQQQSPMGSSSIQAGYRFAEAAAGLFSQTIEVFLRRDFGERYFSLFGMFGKLATYLVFLFLAFNYARQQDGLPLGLFFFLSFGLCLWHQFVIWQRKRAGHRWHSRYSGTSHLAALLPFSSFTIKRWIEPLVAILAGFVLSSFSQGLGGWLIFAGCCLAATEALSDARFKTMILDAIDKDIEARNLRDSIVENKGATHTEGFEIPVAGMSTQQRASLFQGLSPQYESFTPSIPSPADLPPLPVAPIPPPVAPAPPPMMQQWIPEEPAPFSQSMPVYVQPAPQIIPTLSIICPICDARNPTENIFCEQCRAQL